MMKYTEYSGLNLPEIAKDILAYWERENIFEQSIKIHDGAEPFVFYEGPPSANGMPGIHHVMGRTIKDIFCRYQTLKGKQVMRKAGWDTHGLPIELAVEKTLGITKEDIGKKITIEDYNKACRTEVMKYQDRWEELTRLMGYWVDMKSPYITYENNYIESVWFLLKTLYEKNLIYKGYSIQPYSPAAGTGLSTHELNQPGCYRNVKDSTAVAMFKVIKNAKSEALFASTEGHGTEDVRFMAWTTTPWTLPSNTALAVGERIDYALVRTFHPFTFKPIILVLAQQLVSAYFPEKNASLQIADYKEGDKAIPFQILTTIKGKLLSGISYERLMPFDVEPFYDGDSKLGSFRVVCGDFVTTVDGTGIVHIAPSFGSDDFRVAKLNGIGALTLVDKRGKFLPEVEDGVFLFGEEFVKADYLNDAEKQIEFMRQKTILEKNGKIKDLKEYLSVDERIILKIQEEGKLFKKEKYEHSYPHCWRTDKPILYYPLDSWFVRVTAKKDRMVELNKTIQWKPEHTGTGRFGEWLNNLLDWNLSRSRFWGIPLPIWRSVEDGSGMKSEERCIGSIEELSTAIELSVKAGYMKENPLEKPDFDLHKPYADDIVLVDTAGRKMFREPDLIDVWFDSGAMPYAQLHYPFENKNLIDSRTSFPADFIAEGVDQTRGWFYTLHAIAVLCFDSVAFKNVVSNGLVLDKAGNKMSKRLGNAIDPFVTLAEYGPDATRWYMITNASPWDNLKFDLEGIKEKQRSFFGTLYNTYSFFALYANIDGFVYREDEILGKNRPEIDRWILSELNSLIEFTDTAFKEYEPTRAGRAIEYFVDEHLSNWYVRLCRRRFWKGDYSKDKISAYQTLYQCLVTIAKISSPIAPFFCDRLYKDLNDITKKNSEQSVHLSQFPKSDKTSIDKVLEERMELAQKISSMVLSIRKRENIRVRQPLQKIRIPLTDKSLKSKVEAVKELILSEVNVKEIEFMEESEVRFVKNLKLNFKTLGKKCGKDMKAVQQYALENPMQIIEALEKRGTADISIGAATYTLEKEDAEIIPVDIPGWKVANQGSVTVALDITLNEALLQEGLARELVNRIQNLRKDKDFEVTDSISVQVQSHEKLDSAVSNFLHYICAETLAKSIEITPLGTDFIGEEIEIGEDIRTRITLTNITAHGNKKNKG